MKLVSFLVACMSETFGFRKVPKYCSVTDVAVVQHLVRNQSFLGVWESSLLKLMC